MSVYENLEKLNITIPKAPDPVGAYVASKKIANLLYISGQISIDSSGKIIKGKLIIYILLKELQRMEF